LPPVSSAQISSTRDGIVRLRALSRFGIDRRFPFGPVDAVFALVQFDAEVAVAQRGVHRAIARIAQHHRHGVADKRGMRNAPVLRPAIEREQSLSRRDVQLIAHDLAT